MRNHVRKNIKKDSKNCVLPVIRCSKHNKFLLPSNVGLRNTIDLTLEMCNTSLIYTLKNAGLNTTQCWGNVRQNTCWVVFNLQLGWMFNPTFWAVTKLLGLNNPITGFIHILPSAGLYLTQHFLESTDMDSGCMWNLGRAIIAFLWQLTLPLCSRLICFKKISINTLQCCTLFTLTFINLADAFIQSDLQLRNTISDTL